MGGKQSVHSKRKAVYKYKNKIKSFLKELKEKTPCSDCRKNYPFYVMEFDHREGVHKIDNISAMVANTRPLLIVQEELLKCDIVCANCHRQRTYIRLINIG